MKINNIILDLRGNEGGDPNCGNNLLSYLIPKPFIYFNPRQSWGYKSLNQLTNPATNNFNGNLLILIDGGCFSTTPHVASLLKYYKVGKFIGQETGGGYSCNSNPGWSTLKNTHIQVGVSESIYSTMVTGQEIGKGIVPDYLVSWTVEDYLNGRDPVMSMALNIIDKMKH